MFVALSVGELTDVIIGHLLTYLLYLRKVPDESRV